MSPVWRPGSDRRPPWSAPSEQTLWGCWVLSGRPAWRCPDRRSSGPRSRRCRAGQVQPPLLTRDSTASRPGPALWRAAGAGRRREGAGTPSGCETSIDAGGHRSELLSCRTGWCGWTSELPRSRGSGPSKVASAGPAAAMVHARQPRWGGAHPCQTGERGGAQTGKISAVGGRIDAADESGSLARRLRAQSPHSRRIRRLRCPRHHASAPPSPPSCPATISALGSRVSKSKMPTHSGPTAIRAMGCPARVDTQAQPACSPM